jgi:hypothetical protein
MKAWSSVQVKLTWLGITATKMLPNNHQLPVQLQNIHEFWHH